MYLKMYLPIFQKVHKKKKLPHYRITFNLSHFHVVWYRGSGTKRKCQGSNFRWSGIFNIDLKGNTIVDYVVNAQIDVQVTYCVD